MGKQGSGPRQWEGKGGTWPMTEECTPSEGSAFPLAWAAYISLPLLIAVSIAWSVQRKDGRPGFDSRQSKDFSLLVCVQAASGVHVASCPMGMGEGGSFSGCKAASA